MDPLHLEMLVGNLLIQQFQIYYGALFNPFLGTRNRVLKTPALYWQMKLSGWPPLKLVFVLRSLLVLDFPHLLSLAWVGNFGQGSPKNLFDIP